MTTPRDHFEEHGYYLSRGVFSGDEIRRLEAEFDRIVQQLRRSDDPYAGPNAAADNGIISTTNVQKFSSLWLTGGLLHKSFLDAAVQFIGPDILLQRSSLYQKSRADVEGPFRMHQDWPYGPTRDDTMVSGMIHVCRATESMGALRVYPGTHRARIEGARADADATAFHERFPLEGSTVIEADAGDVLFFHYCLVHGSMSNRTEEPRKVVHVRMFSGRDRVEKDATVPNKLPIDTKAWTPGAGGDDRITAISIDEAGEKKDALLGLFRDDRGQRYFMVTSLWHGANASAQERALSITMNFAPDVRRLYRLDRITGREVPVRLNRGTLRTTLPGGTGDLYKYTSEPFPGQPGS